MSIQGKRGADDGTSQSNVQEGPPPKRDCVKTNTIAKNKAHMKEIRDCIDPIYHELQVKQWSKKHKDFIDDLRERYKELEGGFQDKVVVGLLGKTGAGKSSLLNAVLGIPRLLPSGNIGACTSVIIKVMANTSPEFEADVEFISKEDWEAELKRLLEVIRDKEQNWQMVDMAKSKIRALYGKDVSEQDIRELLKMQTFNDLLSSGKKTISYQSASELSTSILCYIRSNSMAAEGTCSYWPIVKSVTIKVPNAPDFMDHIVLVDLPGSGDWNKTRDSMWESFISKCSAVWIVSEINRCSSENEAWTVLDNATLVNRGQCHTIAFICTKTDNTSKSDWEDPELDTAGQDLSTLQTIENSLKHAFILRCNKNAKIEINEKITNRNYINRQNMIEISVHTVSSEEFKRQQILTTDETEIPDLRKLLGKLNDRQSEKLTRTYVNNAHGILSLIDVTNCDATKTFEKEKNTFENKLTQRLEDQLTVIDTYMSKIHEEFKELLSKAVKKSTESCLDRVMNDIIKPERDNRGYHQTLRAICNGNGYSRTKRGEIQDMNDALARLMYEAIDCSFTTKFPNIRYAKLSINEKIDDFNITLECPIPDDCNLFHHLEHIIIEQCKFKEKVIDDIMQMKKEIYASLKQSIAETLGTAYQVAAEQKGKGSMKKMQDVLEAHLRFSNDTMFSTAQEKMLNRLCKLKNHIHEELKSKLQRAINQAFQTPANLALPDVTEELAKIKKIKDQLIAGTDTLEESHSPLSQTSNTAPQVPFSNVGR